MERTNTNLTETETEIFETRILHLRPPERRVQFTDDTVDNEELNKKRSNSNI